MGSNVKEELVLEKMDEIIKLDFLKLDLLNSDRGYSTDNYSTYSEDAPSPSLSSSTQSRDKSEVDINRKNSIEKGKDFSRNV